MHSLILLDTCLFCVDLLLAMEQTASCQFTVSRWPFCKITQPALALFVTSGQHKADAHKTYEIFFLKDGWRLSTDVQ